MQHLEHARLGLPQPLERLELVLEQGGGLARVGHGVVDALADQLVILHQAVVGILRESRSATTPGCL